MSSEIRLEARAKKAKFNYDDEMIYQMFVLCHQSAESVEPTHNIFSQQSADRAARHPQLELSEAVKSEQRN
jgi:hypothetical protein